MAAVSALTYIAGAAALAGTASQVDSSNNQRRQAGQLADANKIDSASAKKVADNRQLQTDNQAATAAAKKQKDSLNTLNAPNTRNGTLLTSPLGAPSTPQVGGKTLLGM